MTPPPDAPTPNRRSDLLGELYRIARRLVPVEASASEETTDACGASVRLLAIADGWRDDDVTLHAAMRRAAGWPVGILRFDALADHTIERVAALVAELRTARETVTTPPDATPIDLDAHDRIEAAMTPGPWSEHGYSAEVIGPEGPDDAPVTDYAEDLVARCDHGSNRIAGGTPQGFADCRGIVTMRNAWPALVAELRTARETIEDWRNATAAETPHDARERRKDMESAIGQEHERTASLSTDLGVAGG